MQVKLVDAISQIRDDLRDAIVEGADQDIVFTTETVDLELSITFGTELKAGGGVKLLAFLNLSGEAKTSDSQQHRIMLSLKVADRDGNPIKVRSDRVPEGL